MAMDIKKIEELTQNLFQSWKTDADRLSEQDTKTNYIEPVLTCLGWDPVDNLARGEANSDSDNKPDYVLHANNVNYLVVEAKALQHRLDLKDAERAQENALHANANWCLVTKGYFYKVYNRNWDIEPKERLFFKTSLTEDIENFSRFLYKIDLISKQSMAEGKIDLPGQGLLQKKEDPEATRGSTVGACPRYRRFGWL